MFPHHAYEHADKMPSSLKEKVKVIKDSQILGANENKVTVKRYLHKSVVGRIRTQRGNF